ncbi:MAG: twin-arginine translocation signal domain-containing protein [Pirellulaceae bacterium]|nr:twin-arginine translocation signal domain-containing protein [Pirellulaceae bacterium]
MNNGITRRTFIEGSAAGAASLGLLGALQNGSAAEPPLAPKAKKVRVGKIIFGVPHPGWPMATVDVEAERRRVEGELARLQPQLADIEWIDCGLISKNAEFEGIKEKLRGADGILILQLTMGMRRLPSAILELDVPTVLFAEPFCGHEWCTIAALQQQGKLIDCWASSKFEDVVRAVSPIRALGRLKDAKVLHVSQHQADPAYVKAIEEKFGTEIKSLGPDDLEAAYKAVDEQAARAEAERWIAGAEKVVEPTRDDMLKAARMALAVMEMVRAEQADVITINCLGMKLVERDMGYPCLGFAKLNDLGLGGVCEADLKSTMTHLIFSYLVGKPGFVTDPCFDYSNSTILHAHCVAATKMLGPDEPAHPYIIRSHLEDNRSAALQVKLPVGRKVSMAKLIGSDQLLFSTGDAIDSPLLDRGCRTKLTVRVPNPEKFMEGWTSGLHRVIFYGDHTRDIERFCRFARVRLLREGVDDLLEEQGLPKPPQVQA